MNCIVSTSTNRHSFPLCTFIFLEALSAAIFQIQVKLLFDTLLSPPREKLNLSDLSFLAFDVCEEVELFVFQDIPVHLI